MNRAVRNLLLLSAVIAVVGVSVGEARADSVNCKSFEIKASKAQGGVDPALKPLAKKLSKPPFDSWTKFEALASHDNTVERMKAMSLTLVPGGKLTLLFRDRLSQKGKKERLRLSFTLDAKSGKRLADATVQLDAGDYNLIGGEPLGKGATYILATTCK